MANSRIIMGIDDVPMWRSIERRRLELQACDDCSHVRYPPAPVCPKCLSLHATWKPVAGCGTIVSWVVFHRKYFDDHVPPYNSVAVRLDEGPIVVSQLLGPTPSGSWIGARVELAYAEHAGRMQHHLKVVDPSSAEDRNHEPRPA